MNRLTTNEGPKIVALLVEGMPIRWIRHMTGASMSTIVKLLADAGAAFSDYQSKAFHNLPCKRIQWNKQTISGNPKEAYVSTSCAERATLSMRMGCAALPV